MEKVVLSGFQYIDRVVQPLPQCKFRKFASPPNPLSISSPSPLSVPSGPQPPNQESPGTQSIWPCSVLSADPEVTDQGWRCAHFLNLPLFSLFSLAISFIFPFSPVHASAPHPATALPRPPPHSTTLVSLSIYLSEANTFQRQILHRFPYNIASLLPLSLSLHHCS